MYQADLYCSERNLPILSTRPYSNPGPKGALAADRQSASLVEFLVNCRVTTGTLRTKGKARSSPTERLRMNARALCPEPVNGDRKLSNYGSVSVSRDTTVIFRASLVVLP